MEFTQNFGLTRVFSTLLILLVAGQSQDTAFIFSIDVYKRQELERVTKAPKNLIRNRYNRAKKKPRIAKE